MSGGKQKVLKRQLFPEKLWELVNKPSSGIQWSPDGKRIEVERSKLEKFNGTKFRSHNFDSFIRQLHFYGFRKTGNSYHHDKFQRDQPEALLTMKRKYSNLPLRINNASNSSTNAANTSIVSSTGAIDLSGVAIKSDLSLVSTIPLTPSINIDDNNNNNNDNNNNNNNINEIDSAMECAIDYSRSSAKLKNVSSIYKTPSKSIKLMRHEPIFLNLEP